MFIFDSIDSQGFFLAIGLVKIGFGLLWISLIDGYIKGTWKIYYGTLIQKFSQLWDTLKNSYGTGHISGCLWPFSQMKIWTFKNILNTYIAQMNSIFNTIIPFQNFMFLYLTFYKKSCKKVLFWNFLVVFVSLYASNYLYKDKNCSIYWKTLKNRCWRPITVGSL